MDTNDPVFNGYVRYQQHCLKITFFIDKLYNEARSIHDSIYTSNYCLLRALTNHK